MRSIRILAIAGLTALPLVPTLSAPPTAADAVAPPSSAMSTLLDWQEHAIDAVYVEGRVIFPPSTTETAVPAPVGPVYLGFVSLAVHEAVERARIRGTTSASTAIAKAAHDVLAHYLPNTSGTLDAALADSLADVPDGPAQRKGVRVGRRAAAKLIASREGEVLGGSFPFQLDPTQPGIWAPPPSGMAVAWLGYMQPLVVDDHVDLDGPPALTSDEYTQDFNEVKSLGSLTGTNTEHKAIADFYYANHVPTYERALVTYLRSHPIGVRKAAEMFAVMNASMADGIRGAWRLKREIGFWRPSQAIVRAAEDHNPATEADPAWQPYRANPPYSDYPTGHGVLTGTFAEAARMYLGDAVPLTLVSVPGAPLPDRSYATLSALEDEALMSRIYAGIHFRDAMDDGYDLAHETVHRVATALMIRGLS